MEKSLEEQIAEAHADSLSQPEDFDHEAWMDFIEQKVDLEISGEGI